MIYLADISACSEEALLPLVCEERKDYAAKYRQDADRIRSLGVAALLGMALQTEGYVKQLPVRLTHDENQKPMVDIKSNNLFFSLSHAGNYVAVAVDTKPIGIDIERIRPYKESLTRRFFSKEEQEILARLSAFLTGDSKDHNTKDHAFTQVWTLKESFLKVTGLGLKLGLDTFSIDADPSPDPKQPDGNDPYKTRFSYRQDHDENTYAGRLLAAPEGYAFGTCFLADSPILKAGHETEICYVNLQEWQQIILC